MSEQTFLTHLESHFEEGPFRKEGWQKLAACGLPLKSHEAFRYVHLRELYTSTFRKNQSEAVDFSEAILPECKHSHIVFVNGHFSPQHSDLTALPSQTVVLPLDQAMQAHGSFLKGHLTRSIKEENDPFALANLALHRTGAFVYVPPKLEVAVPLQCLSIATGDEPTLIAPRLHLVLGAHSSLRCILTTEGQASHFNIPTEEISLEEGASLDLLQLVDAEPYWHFETLRASLKKNARLNTLAVTFGGRAMRHSYRVQLKGEGSEASLNGLWMLKGNRSSHTHALVEHEAPHTRSMQRFKGTLNDHSQSSFEGKILVRPEAQKTEAYQLNNNLILSQGAVANSKPNLEIFADDVKASHGATFAQINQEQLFYLQTRGIEPDLARCLLIQGFCREMITGIPYDSLLKKIDQKMKVVL